MRKKTIGWLLIDLTLLLIATLYYITIYLLGTTCLIKKAIGIDCPTCGLTRSLICLLKGDIHGYFEFNFLSLPTLLILYLSFHIKNEKIKKILNVLIIALALAIFIRYIIKFYI